MAYTSYIYLLVFLTSTFLLYTIMPKKYKWIVLLTASYVFYLINSGKYIIFLLASTASTYFTGRFLNKAQDSFLLAKKSMDKEDRKSYKELLKWQKRAIVAIMLLFNFGLLLTLKYYNFFGDTIENIVGLFKRQLSLPELKLALPLGISFYTLQAASYVIDVYRGKYRATDNFGKVALFLSFFPEIVEGPIGRFDLLADKLYEGHNFDYRNLTFGVQLIAWGFFKKLIIADRCNAFVNTVFDAHADYSGFMVIAAMLLYTVQIYCEFSGCMDIVTGSAQIFGVPLSKNFERPFFSKSVSEFWRRWHMTLGSWFRDYIFYPISLSKFFMKLSQKTKKHFGDFFGSLIPTFTAMFAVWFGTGIWHGASWKYILYGLYYFAIMAIGMMLEPVIVKFCEKTHINRISKAVSIISMFRTFIIVNIGMLMFRADNLTVFAQMFRSMFAPAGITVIKEKIFSSGMDKYDFFIAAIALIAILIISILQEKGHSIRSELAEKNIVLRWTVYYALIFSVVIFGAYGAGYVPAEFIYAQF